MAAIEENEYNVTINEQAGTPDDKWPFRGIELTITAKDDEEAEAIAEQVIKLLQKDRNVADAMEVNEVYEVLCGYAWNADTPKTCIGSRIDWRSTRDASDWIIAGKVCASASPIGDTSYRHYKAKSCHESRRRQKRTVP